MPLFICFTQDIEPWSRPRDRKERVVAEKAERIRRKEERLVRLQAEIARLKEQP